MSKIEIEYNGHIYREGEEADFLHDGHWNRTVLRRASYDPRDGGDFQAPLYASTPWHGGNFTPGIMDADGSLWPGIDDLRPAGRYVDFFAREVRVDGMVITLHTGEQYRYGEPYGWDILPSTGTPWTLGDGNRYHIECDPREDGPLDEELAHGEATTHLATIDCRGVDPSIVQELVDTTFEAAEANVELDEARSRFDATWTTRNAARDAFNEQVERLARG